MTSGRCASCFQPVEDALTAESVFSGWSRNGACPAVGQLQQLAGAACPPLDRVELRHRAVLVAWPWIASTGQPIREVFGDVPAHELGSRQTSASRRRFSSRRGVSPELSGSSVLQMRAAPTIERMQISSTNTSRHRHHGFHLVAPLLHGSGKSKRRRSGLPGRDSRLSAGKNFRQGKQGFVVHESHAASGLHSTSTARSP